MVIFHDFCHKSSDPAPPPLNGTFGHPFVPHIFLLQLNLTYMKRILHLVWVQNITFKSPLIFGSKLTFTGWSDRWLPYSALLRVKSWCAFFLILVLKMWRTVKKTPCNKKLLPLPLNSMIKTELFRQHQVNPSEDFFQIYLILKHIWPNNAYCRFEFHSDHCLLLLDNIIISTIFTLKKLYLE